MGWFISWVIGVLFWVGLHYYFGLNSIITIIGIVLMTVITVKKAFTPDGLDKDQ